jgi:hypothetical protein
LGELPAKAEKAREAMGIISNWPHCVRDHEWLHPKHKPHPSIPHLVEKVCDEFRPGLFRKALNFIGVGHREIDGESLREIRDGFKTHLDWWWEDFKKMLGDKMPTDQSKHCVLILEPPYSVPTQDEIKSAIMTHDFHGQAATERVYHKFECSFKSDLRDVLDEAKNTLSSLIETEGRLAALQVVEDRLQEWLDTFDGTNSN